MTNNSDLFRSALSTFTTGVCVVSSACEQNLALGMTINSFSSLSLSPLLVLWSIQNDSECLQHFCGNTRFAINVLGVSQEALSRQYAVKGSHSLDTEHFTLSDTGTPLLKACLANFECINSETLVRGDHTLIIGEVVGIHQSSDSSPLVFHGGRYKSLEI